MTLIALSLGLLGSLAFPASSTAQEQEDYREWTNTRGETIEARMLRDNGDGTIRLLRRDGWQGDVPLNLFSDADREYVSLAAEAAGLAQAEARHSENFQISRLRRRAVPGYISTPEGWERQIPCLQAEVKYAGSSHSAEASVKAYFFDEQGKQVANFNRPPRRELVARGGNYIEVPEDFRRGEDHEVYFPLSRAVTDGRWRTAIVVFGNDDEVSAAIMPHTANLIEFDFPEKSLLYPDWSDEVAQAMSSGSGESPASPGGEGAMPPGLELRRLSKTRHQRQTRFNNSWQRGKECLAGEIRCNGRPPSDELAIRAYFFDGDKKMKEARDGPSMTNTEQSVYIAVPDIARTGQWYPFFFALDRELENLDWRWAVVVAEADGEFIAGLAGPSSASLDDFDFPGKDQGGREEPSLVP